ncbi:MAG: glycosyltransferase family 4 protein [Burkholderiales bacterium]|nr:glycosyltransferase family 4 protein [Phycisphaerae bacterium]
MPKSLTPNQKTLLVVSQTFVPDPASVGQHMADVAVEMARRGRPVRVYASARGYEDSSVVYPARENLHGVDVRRLALGSFGKRNLLFRAAGTAWFMFQAFFAALFAPNIGAIFFSTSPPLIGFPMSIVGMLRRVPVAYWAMDLNPDQLIAMKKIGPRSFAAWLLERVNRFILRRSALVIALDRFMADRLMQRTRLDGKLLVMPPWPHVQHTGSLAHADNPFRTQHGWGGKFVIMYSGNHSPANPLRTLLDAAVRMKDDARVVFAFVGGGSGKKEVDQTISDNGLTNAVSLPYQPLETLHLSLSSADVHVVSMGDDMVGIIHPCKVYGAMSVGRPILFLGPAPSHVADILNQHPIGEAIRHGDVDGCVAAIRRLAELPEVELNRMGLLAQQVLDSSLSQNILQTRFCDGLETTMHLAAPD